jgi:hypothetical protein
MPIDRNGWEPQSNIRRRARPRQRCSRTALRATARGADGSPRRAPAAVGLAAVAARALSILLVYFVLHIEPWRQSDDAADLGVRPVVHRRLDTMGCPGRQGVRRPADSHTAPTERLAAEHHVRGNTIRFHTAIPGDSIPVELVRAPRHFQLAQRQFTMIRRQLGQLRSRAVLLRQERKPGQLATTSLEP